MISAKQDAKAARAQGAIHGFKMVGRPIAEAMSARFPPRPREEQGAPDPRIAAMDFDRLFAFSRTCLEAEP